MQMINAGFNPLEQIAKRTGKTVGYWKEQMSKGKVTMDMVTQAMKDATSEGGRYHNMMLKMSKTAGGQLSTLQDNWNMALANFGKEILPLAIKGMNALSKVLEKINSMTPAQKKFLLVVASIVAIIGPLVAGIGTVITTITSLSVAASALGTVLTFLSANPIVLTIAAWTAGIAALIGLVVLLVKNWDKVIAGIKNAIQWIGRFIDKLGPLASIIPGLNMIKAGKDIAGFVGDRISQNSVRQTQNNNSVVNNNNVTNNYGGGGGFNSLTPLASGVYAIP